VDRQRFHADHEDHEAFLVQTSFAIFVVFMICVRS